MTCNSLASSQKRTREVRVLFIPPLLDVPVSLKSFVTFLNACICCSVATYSSSGVKAHHQAPALQPKCDKSPSSQMALNAAKPVATLPQKNPTTLIPVPVSSPPPPSSSSSSLSSTSGPVLQSMTKPSIKPQYYNR